MTARTRKSASKQEFLRRFQQIHADARRWSGRHHRRLTTRLISGRSRREFARNTGETGRRPMTPPDSSFSLLLSACIRVHLPISALKLTFLRCFQQTIAEALMGRRGSASGVPVYSQTVSTYRCAMPPWCRAISFFCAHPLVTQPDAHPAIAPATAPLTQVASVPETIERIPSCTTSARRSGIIMPMPPTMMPALPKLAKPHSA